MKYLKNVILIGIITSINNLHCEIINGIDLLFKKGDILTLPKQDHYKGNVAIVLDYRNFNDYYTLSGKAEDVLSRAEDVLSRNDEHYFYRERYTGTYHSYFDILGRYRIHPLIYYRGDYAVSDSGLIRNVNFVFHVCTPYFKVKNQPFYKKNNLDLLENKKIDLLKSYKNVLNRINNGSYYNFCSLKKENNKKDLNSIERIYLPFLRKDDFHYFDKEKKIIVLEIVNTIKTFLKNNKIKKLKEIIFVLDSDYDLSLFEAANRGSDFPKKGYVKSIIEWFKNKSR